MRFLRAQKAKILYMNKLWPCVVRVLLQSFGFGGRTVTSGIVRWVSGRRTGFAFRPPDKFVSDVDWDVDRMLGADARVSLEWAGFQHVGRLTVPSKPRSRIAFKSRTSPSITMAWINHHRPWYAPESFSWRWENKELVFKHDRLLHQSPSPQNTRKLNFLLVLIYFELGMV